MTSPLPSRCGIGSDEGLYRPQGVSLPHPVTGRWLSQQPTSFRSGRSKNAATPSHATRSSPTAGASAGRPNHGQARPVTRYDHPALLKERGDLREGMHPLQRRGGLPVVGSFLNETGDFLARERRDFNSLQLILRVRCHPQVLRPSPNLLLVQPRSLHHRQEEGLTDYRWPGFPSEGRQTTISPRSTEPRRRYRAPASPPKGPS